jgi:uncharacterized protein with FMN-binding domain
MKRTVIVVAATAAGLAGVLAFHTSPLSVTSPPGQGTAAAPPEPAPPEPGTSPSPSGSGAGSPGPASTASPASGATRTVDGPAVNFSFGVLSVSVTVRGRTIVKVGIASLSDDGNFRSQFIDEQSIPELEQEALSAQSASIQGVSGASYTSAGFRTSLQDALHTLGLQ